MLLIAEVRPKFQSKCVKIVGTCFSWRFVKEKLALGALDYFI